jgi:hypothetical protein
MKIAASRWSKTCQIIVVLHCERKARAETRVINRLDVAIEITLYKEKFCLEERRWGWPLEKDFARMLLGKPVIF